MEKSVKHIFGLPVDIFVRVTRIYEVFTMINLLSKAEEMFLLAIYRLEDNAYGVTIRKQILDTTGKDYTYGTLYGILEQLVRKGYILRIKGDPTPERGGRSKTFYTLTPEGVASLKNAMEVHQQVWKGISRITLHKA